mmetsp:Transcript_61325/g.168324  ORF Transcript_61325/g.168324 Transcript_61325/m.168324 type:complete len:96 (-) Transcript_61325:108-395(-)
MVELKIPAGSQPASRLVMRNKGAQRVNGPASSRGNLYVHLKLEVPRNITDRQRELMEEFAQEEGETKKTWTQTMVDSLKSFISTSGDSKKKEAAA